MRAIAAHEPFPAKAVERSDGKLQVALLATKPRPRPPAKQVLELATDEDRLVFEGFELYWLPNGVMSRFGAQPEGPIEKTGRSSGR